MAGESLRIAEELCKRFEGFRSRPYLCPAGIPTIGYGSTFYLSGQKVSLHDGPISQAVALVMLRATLAKVYLPAARRCCPKATEPELAALADFAYNLGCGRLASSTLRKRMNAGDKAGARAELKKWIRGGGKILPGLVARREAEAALIGRQSTDDGGAETTTPSTQ